MSSHPAPEPPDLATAVSTLLEGRIEAVVEQVRDGLVRLGDAELGEVTAAALRGRALLEGLAFASTAEADSRGVVAAWSAAGTAQWVRARAGEGGVPMTPSVAGTYATVVDATRSPGMAELKDATATGEVSVAGAGVAAREFRSMQPVIDPACHEPGLRGVIDYCAGGASGRQLGQMRERHPGVA